MLEVRSSVLIPNVMAEIEHEGEDFEEVVEKVKKFLRDSCGCTLGPKNGPCSLQFTEETVLFNLNNCLELSSAELDLVILTCIQAFTRAEFIGCKRSSRCSLPVETNLQGHVFVLLPRQRLSISST